MAYIKHPARTTEQTYHMTLQDQTFAENVPLAVEVSKSERAHYQALTKEKVKRSYPFFVFKVGSEKWPKHCFLEF